MNTPIFRGKSGPALFTTCALLAACLDGNAEPIVRINADSGTPVNDGSVVPSACDPNAPLPFYYRNVKPEPSPDAIDFLLKIANNTGAPLPLSELSVRYYFTDEVTTSPQTSVFYTGTCCGDTRANFSGVTATSVPFTPSTANANADHYLEVTFDAAAGTLQAGDAVQVEPSYFALNHGQTLNQTNDYSYIAAQTSTQAEWDACPTACGPFGSCLITVYRNGILIWGSPP